MSLCIFLGHLFSVGESSTTETKTQDKESLYSSYRGFSLSSGHFDWDDVLGSIH